MPNTNEINAQKRQQMLKDNIRYKTIHILNEDGLYDTDNIINIIKQKDEERIIYSYEPFINPETEQEEIQYEIIHEEEYGSDIDFYDFYLDMKKKNKNTYITISLQNLRDLELSDRREFYYYLKYIYYELRGMIRLEYINDYIQRMGSPKITKKMDFFDEREYCKNHMQYFIENYVLLSLPSFNGNFILNQTQEEYIYNLFTTNDCVVLKSRQIGISTITQGIIAYIVVFFKNLQIGVVSKDKDEASTFVRYIKDMLGNLPNWLKIKYDKDNEQLFIVHQTKCTVMASQVRQDRPEKTFRGKPLTILVIDEQAFIANLDIQLTGMQPSISRQQKIQKQNNIPFFTSEISTPNGTEGDGLTYYEHIQQQLNQLSSSKYLQLHWSQVPEFADDPDWYEEQKRKNKYDERKINQEYELKFLGSKLSIFTDSQIEKIQEQTLNPKYEYRIAFVFKPVRFSKLDKMEIIYLKNEDDYKEFQEKYRNNLNIGILNIYESQKPDRQYVMGIDVATLSGSDDSSATILDIYTRRINQTFKGKLKMKNYQRVIEWMKMNVYTNSLLVPESNGVGKGLVEDHLQGNENVDPYMYYTVKFGKNGKETSRNPGLAQNQSTRAIMLDYIYEYVTDTPEQIICPSLGYQIIQLKRDKSGKIYGDKDDMVLSFQIALFQIYQNYIKDSTYWGNGYSLSNEDKQIFRNILQSNPFGAYNNSNNQNDKKYGTFGHVDEEEYALLKQKTQSITEQDDLYFTNNEKENVRIISQIETDDNIIQVIEDNGIVKNQVISKDVNYEFKTVKLNDTLSQHNEDNWWVTIND